MFLNSKYSAVSDIASVIGKHKTTVLRAFQDKSKTELLRDRGQPFNVERPRLSEDAIENVFAALSVFAPIKSGYDYCVLPYSEDHLYRLCSDQYKVRIGNMLHLNLSII